MRLPAAIVAAAIALGVTVVEVDAANQLLTDVVGILKPIHDQETARQQQIQNLVCEMEGIPAESCPQVVRPFPVIEDIPVTIPEETTTTITTPIPEVTVEP